MNGPLHHTSPLAASLTATLAALVLAGSPHVAFAQGGVGGAAGGAAPGSVAAAARPPQAGATNAARPLSLDDALRLAGDSSDIVAIAQSAVLRARGQQVKARSQFFPQIYGTASYTRTLRSQYQGFVGNSDTTGGPPNCSTFVFDTTAPLPQQVHELEGALGCTRSSGNPFGSLSKVGFGSPNQYSLGLSLSQNIFTGGRLLAQRHEAAAARRSAEIGLTSARAQLVLQVAQAYYDAALSDRLVGIAQATLNEADTTLVQVRLANQVGTQAEFDVLQAQVTRDNQLPVLIQRRSQRDIAYLRLKQLLHLPLDQPLALTTSLGDTAAQASTRLAALTSSAPDTATDDRGPVREQVATVESQEGALTVARSERLPALTISSAFGRVAFPAGGFPAWSDFRTNWTITAGLQLPLFTWGNLRGDRMIAEANLAQARAQLRQTRQLAAVDTRNAVASLAAAEAQWSASVGTVQQAVRAYQIATVRYQQGISTQTELASSRIQLDQSEANRAQAARDLQIARVQLALIRDLPITPSTTSASAAGSAASATTPALVVPPMQSAPAPGQTQTSTSAATTAASTTGAYP